MAQAAPSGGATYTPPVTEITNLTSNSITLTQDQLDTHINGVFHYKPNGNNFIPHAVPVRALRNGDLAQMRSTGNGRINWVQSTRTLTIADNNGASLTSGRFAYAVLIG